MISDTSRAPNAVNVFWNPGQAGSSAGQPAHAHALGGSGLALLLRLWLALFAQQVDTNGPFQFQKSSQFFIRVHNETLSVVAMRVSNPDRSSAGINR
jgi:hypothetical protein